MSLCTAPKRAVTALFRLGLSSSEGLSSCVIGLQGTDSSQTRVIPITDTHPIQCDNDC
jgi:hypothetical protein